LKAILTCNPKRKRKIGCLQLKWRYQHALWKGIPDHACSNPWWWWWWVSEPGSKPAEPPALLIDHFLKPVQFIFLELCSNWEWRGVELVMSVVYKLTCFYVILSGLYVSYYLHIYFQSW
jgi:hypothetical protein